MTILEKRKYHPKKSKHWLKYGWRGVTFEKGGVNFVFYLHRYERFCRKESSYGNNNSHFPLFLLSR